MLYANSKNGEKQRPYLKGRAFCPYCNHIMMAKCGDYVVWHWAHESGARCDSFSKEESEWHIEWKKKFPKENVEIIVNRDDEKHIADVYLPGSRTAIEFQNSSITAKDVNKRTDFYDHIIWVFNVDEAYEEDRLYEESFGNYVWKHPRKTIRNVYWKSRVFLDNGYELLKVNSIHTKEYNDFGGADWDLDIESYEYNEFIEELKSEMHWKINLYALQPKKQIEQLELF